MLQYSLMTFKKITYILSAAIIAPALFLSAALAATYTDEHEGSKVTFKMETEGFAMEENTEQLVLKGIAKLHRTYAGEFSLKYKAKKGGVFSNGDQASFTIKIFNDFEKFKAYAVKLRATAFAKEGRAFYVVQKRLMVLYLKSNTLSTLFHEVSHYFFNSQFSNANGKLWLDEGLAMYFQNIDIFQAEMVIHAPDNLYFFVKKMAGDGSLPELKDYLDLTRKEWRGENETMNYVIGWSLSYFMMSNDEGKKVLQTLLDYSKRSGRLNEQKKNREVPVENIIEKTYSGGLKKFEEDWRSFFSSEAVPASHKL